MYPTSEAVGGFAANIALPLLATTAVVLRFVARARKGQAWQIDDWIIMAALVSTYREKVI